MSTFAELQHLCATLLDSVRENPEHLMIIVQRVALYTVLGATIDATFETYRHICTTGRLPNRTGHYRYGYLAIRTAQYVLPIWRDDMQRALALDDTFPIDLPEQMLDTALGVLQGTRNIIEAERLLNGEYHHAFGALVNAPHPTYCAANAAYDALRMILGLPPFGRVLRGDETDVTIDVSQGDVVTSALAAYTAIDKNNSPQINRHITPFIPIEFDRQKRLTFWEWWLTDAVPSVWNSGEV